MDEDFAKNRNRIQKLYPNIKREILDVIFKHLDREKCVVFLFGSFAKGEESTSSDIDIGIMCNEPVEGGKTYEISEDLNEEVRTLRKIDFIDFARVNDPIFAKEALAEVEIWYQGKDSGTALETLRKLSGN